MLKKLVLSLAFVVGACSGDSTAPLHEDSYTLRTIDGDTLPLLLAGDSAAAISVVSGTIVLRTDLTFSQVLRFRYAIAAQPPYEMNVRGKGTYTQSGNALSLTDVENSTTVAVTMRGDTLSTFAGPYEIIYVKE